MPLDHNCHANTRLFFSAHSSRTTDPTHIPHSPSVKNCTNGKSRPSSRPTARGWNHLCLHLSDYNDKFLSTIWVSHCMKSLWHESLIADCVFYCGAGVHIISECCVRPPHLLIRRGASVERDLLPGGGVEPEIHTFTSLTTSNFFFVAKKDLRPCIDYRAFNKVTITY